jgi:hypothetical protein
MITKNSAGADLSTTYSGYVTADSRQWQAGLYVNGVQINCAIKRIEITKGCCGSENFSIGNVVSSMLSADVMELSENLTGKVVEVRIGLFTGADYEWITLGFFTVDRCKGSTYSTVVTGYGKTYTSLAGSFTAPATQTLASVASAIATSAGCSVLFDSGIDTSSAITANMSGLSNYQALAILAGLVGGYAVDTNDGNIAVHKFSSVTTLTVNTGMMLKLPNVEEEQFTVTGVRCVVTPASEDEQGAVVPEVAYEYPDGGVFNLITSDPYMTQAVFSNIYAPNVVGYSYTPADIELSLGDPRIEGNDVLLVQDLGASYTVPAHTVKHIYDGGFRTQISATRATLADYGVVNNAPLTQRIDEVSASATSARIFAEQAKTYAEQAKETTDEINAYAEVAGKTVTQILQDGETAGEKAQEAIDSAKSAESSATSANSSANNALEQLSVIENVVGVLDLLSKHGTYAEITDTEAVAENGKWYFVRSGTGTTADPYTYSVANLNVGDSVTGYYELTDIDQAVTNYVSSHLALTDDGLSLQQDGSDYRILISTDGLKIIGANGATVASYGADTIIGNQTGFHVKMDGTELGFYQGAQRVAYINNNQLYITQSVVLQQMDLGTSVVDGGLGQWSWKVHPNGETPSRNNLNLKWIG